MTEPTGRWRKGRRWARSVVVTMAMVSLIGLVPSPVAAFELRDCNLALQSFDREDRPLDTAIGNSAGGEGGTSDDPFRVDYAGIVRYEGDTGDQVITDASWSVNVFLIPTPARGSGPNEERETSAQGEIDVGRTLPFRTSGLFYLSGELAGEGGTCRGGLWIRIGAEPGDPPAATTIPFWIALALILIGTLTLWVARPGLLVATRVREVR